MATRDLINLGIAPDSGTGDSARRGGEKINALFADVYTMLGDAPVGQDATQPFYGYRRPFFEYEYRVGELHQTGRFIPIDFKTTNSFDKIYDSTYGYGYNSNGVLVDSDGDGIPNIYRDSEWYFLSRGEMIDVDLSEIDSDNASPGQVHLVLPIAAPGDRIIVRDGFNTWEGKTINVWSTPFEFTTSAQVDEWKTYTNSLNPPGDEATQIYTPHDGLKQQANWHTVDTTTQGHLAALGYDLTPLTTYPDLIQSFTPSNNLLDPNNGESPFQLFKLPGRQLEFLYQGYDKGWVLRIIKLDAADTAALADQLQLRQNKMDSDLQHGFWIATDSDVLSGQPLVSYDAAGNFLNYGKLSFVGQANEIKTFINDNHGEVDRTVQFRLDDSIKVKNNVTIGNVAQIGDSLSVAGNALTVDSDDLIFTGSVDIREQLQVGREAVFYDDVTFLDNAFFDSDVAIQGNLTVNGTTTYVNTTNLEVGDNLIVLNKNQATPFNDIGFIFQRFDSDAVTSTNWNASFIWTEADDTFVFGETESSGINTNPSITTKHLTIGDAPAATAPFVFDMSGASDPGGLNRPTFTGNGTGVIDGGVL